MDKKKSTVVGVAGGALFGYAVGYEYIKSKGCDTPPCPVPIVSATPFIVGGAVVGGLIGYFLGK